MDPPPYYQPTKMAPMPSEKSQLDAIQPGTFSNSGQGFVGIQPPPIGCVKGGPSILYSSSHTPVVFKDFKGCQSKFLGIAQIIIGVIFVAFNVVSNYYKMEFFFEPFGMCIGAFFIITGLFGITSGTLKKRGFMIVFLVLSVISFVVVILVILQTSVSLYKMLENKCDYNRSQPAYKDDVIYQDEMRNESHPDEYMYPDEMRHERHPDEYIYPGEKQFGSRPISDDSLFLKRRPVMHPDPILPSEMHPNEYMPPDDIIPDEFWPYDVTTSSDIQSGDMPHDDDYSGEMPSGELPVDEEYSGETYHYKTTTKIRDDDEEPTTEATTTQDAQLIVDVFPLYQEPPDEGHDHGAHYDDDPYYNEFPPFESTPRQRNDEYPPIIEDWWWGGESAYDNNDNEGYWSCLPWYELRLAVYSVLLILSVLEGIFAIWGSIICCKVFCCCKVSTPEKIKTQPNLNLINGNQQAFIVTVPNISSHSAYNNGFADTKVQPYEFTNSVALNSEDINSNIKEKINLGFEFGKE